MSRTSNTLAAIACALAAGCTTGCTTVGNGRLVQLDAPGAQALLVPGRTTRAEVLAALGQGTAIRFRSGWETWHYFYREGVAKGWDDVPYIGLFTERIARPTKELVILFDAAGVLRRYSLQEERPAPVPG